jgi:hypothetical protein
MTLKPIVSKSVYVNIYIYKHIFIADYDTQSIECLNIYIYIYIYIYLLRIIAHHFTSCL